MLKPQYHSITVPSKGEHATKKLVTRFRRILKWSRKLCGKRLARVASVEFLIWIKGAMIFLDTQELL